MAYLVGPLVEGFKFIIDFYLTMAIIWFARNQNNFKTAAEFGTNLAPMPGSGTTQDEAFFIFTVV
jgi:hypothetical protein